jgi:hypothetical protein
MTTSKHNMNGPMGKYYEPSEEVRDYLEKELQNLEPVSPRTVAGKKRKFRRKKKGRGRIAKDKSDTFDRIFQGFVDLVYFLEFIESHKELHEFYEVSLKELFGINVDELDTEGRRLRRREAWHHSLFVRLLSSALFRRSGSPKTYDFRIALAYVMVFQGIEAMRARLLSSDDQSEFKIFNSNVENTLLWGRILANRYTDKQASARYRLKF